MKKTHWVVTCIAFFCAAASAFADVSQYSLIDASSLNFVAPAVPNTSAVADKVVGTIVYDASTNQFKGLNSSGSWDPMTSPVNPNVTSSSTGTERINRISFGGSTSGGIPTSTCTTSTCTIASQSGSWVTTVTRSGAGDYVINFASGEFTAPPTCIPTVYNTASSPWVALKKASLSSTSVEIVTRNSSNVGEDVSMEVICMGPH